MELFSSAEQNLIFTRIVIFWVIILFTVIVNKIVIFFMEKASRNRFSSVMYKAQSFVPQTLYFFGFIIAINQLGLSTSILLLAVGFIGVGFLIGSRKALENMTSRFYLDLFSPYRIGDQINIGSFKGEIIEVNVLNTVLLDEDERLVLLPNTYLLSSAVVNKSKGAKHELHLPVVISKKLDIMEFERRLLKLCGEMTKDLLKSPKPVVVTTRTTQSSEEVTLIVSIRSPEKRSLVTEKLKHKIEEILEDMTEEQQRYTPKKV